MVRRLQGTASTRWDALSKRYRKAYPLCAMCRKEGRISAAMVVDHIIPHKGDQSLLFDPSNLQSLCLNCHNARKQSIERMGYDRAVGEDGWPSDPKHPTNRRA